MKKFVVFGLTTLLGLGAAGFLAGAQDPDVEPPRVKKKDDAKKKDGPGGDLTKAYDLLRRLRSDADQAPAKADAKLRDWTERASQLYRDAVKAHEAREPRRARALGAAAHDLARAIDHVRNASRLSKPDPDLPPPPGPGRGDAEKRLRKDSRKAEDQIKKAERKAKQGDEPPTADEKVYLDAAHQLYEDSKKADEVGQPERAAELARASEALSHVPDHLHAAARGEPGKD